MTESTPSSQKSNDLWMYLLSGFLIYVLVYPFMKKIINGEEAQATLIATVLALIGIYTGKIISKVVNPKQKNIPSGWLVFSIIILVCLVAWIFIFSQFTLPARNPLNLLLFGLPFLVTSILIGAIIHAVRSTIKNNLQEARITAAQSRSELSVLQSQLSPHFLFNTLNNLYGISITQHEKIPPLLLKLSDLLRYSVYETKENFVPLQNEISYLENYIEFERLRMGERLHLKTAIESLKDDSPKIAPMMLIVFVENAFKHGKNSADEKVYIEMELRTWGNFILFSINNSGNTQGFADNDKNNGLGLQNVKKRLELLYPSEHDLHIETMEHEFKVRLQVKIK
ncbi:MAG: GHKL domain-containing protein [Chitinophagaceae bacterium]|nr:MAG: GHKL domain-containing protein [Chitinophagaceae bacterium]